MMDYQTNPEGKPQRFGTPGAAAVVVLTSLLLLIIMRHGLRGLI